MGVIINRPSIITPDKVKIGKQIIRGQLGTEYFVIVRLMIKGGLYV